MTQPARFAPPKSSVSVRKRPNLFIKIPGTKEGLPAIENRFLRGYR
jgi:hypothetical protein